MMGFRRFHKVSDRMESKKKEENKVEANKQMTHKQEVEAMAMDLPRMSNDEKVMALGFIAGMQAAIDLSEARAKENIRQRFEKREAEKYGPVA